MTSKAHYFFITHFSKKKMKLIFGKIMKDTIEMCIFHIFFTAPQTEKIRYTLRLLYFLKQLNKKRPCSVIL